LPPAKLERGLRVGRRGLTVKRKKEKWGILERNCTINLIQKYVREENQKRKDDPTSLSNNKEEGRIVLGGHTYVH